MAPQYIGCTIYFHSSMRYNTTHFAPTSAWHVSGFCGLHQPVLVILEMTGTTGSRAICAAAAGSPGMIFAAP